MSEMIIAAAPAMPAGRAHSANPHRAGAAADRKVRGDNERVSYESPPEVAGGFEGHLEEALAEKQEPAPRPAPADDQPAPQRPRRLKGDREASGDGAAVTHAESAMGAAATAAATPMPQADIENAAWGAETAGTDAGPAVQSNPADTGQAASIPAAPATPGAGAFPPVPARQQSQTAAETAQGPTAGDQATRATAAAEASGAALAAADGHGEQSEAAAGPRGAADTLRNTRETTPAGNGGEVSGARRRAMPSTGASGRADPDGEEHREVATGKAGAAGFGPETSSSLPHAKQDGGAGSRIARQVPDAARPERAATQPKGPGSGQGARLNATAGPTGLTTAVAMAPDTAAPAGNPAAADRAGNGQTSAPVHDPADLLNQVVRAVAVPRNTGVQTVHVQLHPENLGRLVLRVSQSSAGMIEAVIRAERPEVADALRDGLSGLIEGLTGQGLQVRSVEVASAGPQNSAGQGQFSQGQQGNGWASSWGSALGGGWTSERQGRGYAQGRGDNLEPAVGTGSPVGGAGTHPPVSGRRHLGASQPGRRVDLVA